MTTIEEHLKTCKFDNHFKKLTKKLKDKTILIYGAGTLFQHIQKNYDLTRLNIIAISDGKYLPEQKGQKDLGYTIIPKDDLESFNADIVLLGLQNYVEVLCDFASGIYKNKNTKILPLVKIPTWKLLKDIWFN